MAFPYTSQAPIDTAFLQKTLLVQVATNFGRNSNWHTIITLWDGDHHIDSELVSSSNCSWVSESHESAFITLLMLLRMNTPSLVVGLGSEDCSVTSLLWNESASSCDTSSLFSEGSRWDSNCLSLSEESALDYSSVFLFESVSDFAGSNAASACAAAVFRFGFRLHFFSFPFQGVCFRWSSLKAILIGIWFNFLLVTILCRVDFCGTVSSLFSKESTSSCCAV